MLRQVLSSFYIQCICCYDAMSFKSCSLLIFIKCKDTLRNFAICLNCLFERVREIKREK